MADGSLIFDTRTDTSGFNSGVKDIQSGAGKVSSSFAGFGKLLGTLYLFKKAFDIGAEAVSVASDMQEVQNVVDTSFGEMTYKIENFADTCIESFGISKLTAKQTASTFMAMSKGIGLGMEEGSDMSIQATARMADMMSFYNKTAEESSNMMKSVWTGETECLKNIGVVMTETNLKMFAMNQGYTKAYSAMTQAEKVQLRFAYVMDQTNLAAGDFAKTSGSWANQTRMLSESWKEFLGIIGSGLVQLLTPVVKVLNILMQKLIAIANTMSAVVSQLFNKQSQKHIETAKSADVATKSENKLASATAKAGKEAKKSTAGFDELNVLASNTADSADALSEGLDGGFDMGGGITTQEVAVEPTQTEVPGWLTATTDYINNTFKPALMNMWNGISENAMLFGESIKNYLIPMFMEFGAELGKTLSLGFSLACSGIGTIISEMIVPMISTVLRIWTDIIKMLKGKWDEFGTPIFESMRQAMQGVADTWGNIWNSIIKPIFDSIMDTVDWLWNNHLKTLLDNFLTFVSTFIQGALDIYNQCFIPLVNRLVDTLGPGFVNTFNMILGIVSSVIASISDIISGLLTVLTGVIEFIVGVFTGDWDKAWDGVTKIFKGTWEAIVGIFKGIINIIIDILNGLIGAVEMMFNSVVKRVNGIIESINSVSDKVGIKLSYMPEAKLGRIPKLATGTVVPANFGEFQAILGDNKREPEIVSPLSTMKQALKEAMMESGGNGSGDATVILELDGNELARVMLSYMNNETKRKGVQLRSV